jgi:hypothetical protein
MAHNLAGTSTLANPSTSEAARVATAGNVDAETLLMAVWGVAFLVIIVVVLVSRRARRHGGALQAGVVGAMYEWLDKDKQKAVDIIVEGKAAEKRPEYPDGNLPDLGSPKRRPRV